MEVSEGLRGLANSIIDSYEMRARTVSALMNQAYHFLESFQRELEDMIVRLRDDLAKAESLRKKDFDCKMSDIIESHRQRKEEAKQSLKLFQEQEEEIISRLRKIILGGTRSSMEDVNAIKEDIYNRQKEREKKIVKALKCLHIEQEELRAALKNLLSMGKEVKIKDFRIMLKSLRSQQTYRDSELIKMLDDFEMVRDKVQTQWRTVSRVSN